MIKTLGERLKGKQPSEDLEQITFFQQLAKLHPKLARVATHIENEGKRNYNQARKNKMMGAKKGAPDIVILCSPPILIELKSKSKTARASKDQLLFLETAESYGAKCALCYGWEAALLFVAQCIE